MQHILKIVQNQDGDIELRRDNADNEAPIISISIKDETLGFLNKNKLQIAKAMIDAGLEAALEWRENLEDVSDNVQKKYVH